MDGSAADLGPTRPWLVVVRTEQLGNDELGCMRWSVVLGDEPSGIPVPG